MVRYHTRESPHVSQPGDLAPTGSPRCCRPNVGARKHITNTCALRVVQSPPGVVPRWHYYNVYWRTTVQNIEIKVEKDKMILTVDLKKRLKDSTSGKTVIVASTEGNAKIEGHDGLQFGLNVFARKTDASAPTNGTKGK